MRKPKAAGMPSGTGIDKVIADLYFTLPFDYGIIEASQRLDYDDDPTSGVAKDVGKIFVGDPFQVDKEVSETLESGRTICNSSDWRNRVWIPFEILKGVVDMSKEVTAPSEAQWTM